MKESHSSGSGNEITMASGLRYMEGSGVKLGGKRMLTIPAKLGYGARGVSGLIPPHATLLFHIELLGL